MGTSKQGIFGPYKGRTGNVVGTFWKGRNVIKIRTASYSDAQTLPQENQRMSFKIVSAFAAMNKELIKIGFSALRDTATPFNRAIKYNLKYAVAGTYPDLKLDLNQAKISLGDRANLKMPIITAEGKNAIKIEWTDNTGTTHAESTDNVYISVILETGEEALINDTVIKRSDKTATIQLPVRWSGRNVVVNGFTASEKVIDAAKNKSQISDSEVFGRVRVG